MSNQQTTKEIDYEKQEYIYDKKFRFPDFNAEEGQWSIIYELIKQIGSGSDFWRIPVPAFLLDSVSLLERIAELVSPNEFLLKSFTESDPLKRILKITGWMCSVFRKIPRMGIHASKPYNPVLGEQFYCVWKHEDGSETKFISEQTSHHPPISTFYCFNKKHEFSISGSIAPEMSLGLNSVSNIMKGPFIIKLKNEEYLVKLPVISACGIFIGTSDIELFENLEITSKASNLSSIIRFNNTSVDGKIIKEGKEIYSLSGIVNEKVIITNQAGQRGVFYVSNKIKEEEMIVSPLSEQHDLESRKVWHLVTFYLRQRKFDQTTYYKQDLEEKQRERRKHLKDWKPSLFTFNGKQWHLKEEN
jgi:hypothetical protein